ncbi:hypothetical protein SEA_SEPHIROTH_133 [Gordonia Phage Sephiroth]|uniref:Uncharacterized protein n=1 Tax=Gordonia Phage Sephiroth TaxID=2767553 RepID=A0A7G9UZL2_9CAUD|nr:hypothetical protein L3Y23_gp098 [Gordonia Phage Sephiroth]QNN99467.1 hypothetical protein SEA_SEPHIROTH_133 [Gordonia Phage Sephiroth]
MRSQRSVCYAIGMLIETITFYETGGWHARTVKADNAHDYAESIADGRTIIEQDDETFGRVLKVGNGDGADYTLVAVSETGYWSGNKTGQITVAHATLAK